MDIQLKNIKEQKIEFKDNRIYIDGYAYGNHDIIIGFIEDTYVEGRVLFINNNYFSFLQNYKDGGTLENKDKLGFKYAWSFQVYNYSGKNNIFSGAVTLYNYKADKDFNIKEIESKYPYPNFYINKYNKLTSKKLNYSFFQVDNVKKCCGAAFLYDFNMNYTSVKDYYEKFTEEDITELNKFIIDNLNSNKTAYLLESNESHTIDFLINKLNFKIVDEFTNKNTKNQICLLSRND